MLLIKKCCCGGALEVSWSPRAGYRADNAQERTDALKQVEKFDRQHKACRATTSQQSVWIGHDVSTPSPSQVEQ